ncbi:proteoglycan 4b isoform X1 [Syngnathus typhle]|uniref:proteoglycan 4b isoform X1 n=1 Tax=Syngnathus typhle TaxID=161592 RepID=UPI002A6B2C66|nr:proteoglycan 4b isoform X1 [Syngnathus typhle]
MSWTPLGSLLLLACAWSPIASQNSCKGRCGNEYYRGYLCQCDYSCLGYGECCGDFESQCTTKNSCRGRCGESFKRGRLCSCDSDCVKFKQCCPDHELHCDAQEENKGESNASSPGTSNSCDNVDEKTPKEETSNEAEQPLSALGEENDEDNNDVPLVSPISFPKDESSEGMYTENIPSDDESYTPDPDQSQTPESWYGSSAGPLDVVSTQATLIEDTPQASTETVQLATTASEDEVKPTVLVDGVTSTESADSDPTTLPGTTTPQGTTATEQVSEASPTPQSEPSPTADTTREETASGAPTDPPTEASSEKTEGTPSFSTAAPNVAATSEPSKEPSTTPQEPLQDSSTSSIPPRDPTVSSTPSASPDPSSTPALPTQESSMSSVSPDPSQESSTPALTSGPTQESSTPSVSPDPSQESSTPALTSGPTQESSTPSVSPDPSQESSTPALTSGPTQESSTASVSPDPSQESSTPALTSGQTQESSTASVSPDPSQESSTPALTSGPTQKSSTASVSPDPSQESATTSVPLDSSTNPENSEALDLTTTLLPSIPTTLVVTTGHPSSSPDPQNPSASVSPVGSDLDVTTVDPSPTDASEGASADEVTPAKPSIAPVTETQKPSSTKLSESKPNGQDKTSPSTPLMTTTPADKPALKPGTKPVGVELTVDSSRNYQADDSNDTNLCSGRPASAVTTLRNGTIAVFRGHYFWLLDKNRVPGPARGITETWGVPSPIDTVFTRCNCQGNTYIFKRNQYWRFSNNHLDPGYPKVVETGFDGLNGHITAALSVPQYGGRGESVYFFKRGGTVQKYSYRYSASPCNKKAHFAVYTVRRRVVRHAASLLGATINIRTAWRGFPTTITSAVSVPSYREPEGYKYYVFSRTKSYNIRMDGQRPVVNSPRENPSAQNNFINCPKTA